MSPTFRSCVVLLSVCILASCAQKEEETTAPRSASVTSGLRLGQLCVDTSEHLVVSVDAVTADSVTVSGPLKKRRVVATRLARGRFIPLMDFQSSAWVNERDGVAVVFEGLGKMRESTGYHLPGAVWKLDDGEPHNIIRTDHKVSIPMLIQNYRKDPTLLSRIRAREKEMDEEVARRRLAILATKADREMDELNAAAELVLAKEKATWERYVSTREGSREIQDDATYRSILVGAGIRGEGWYASRSDLSKWAQIISVKNIGIESVWFRLWTAGEDGSWDVTPVDVPPLTFAATYVWCGDVPGHYGVTPSDQEAIEVSLVHGTPPMIQFALVRDGKIVPGERPTGLGVAWSEGLRKKRLPLPSAMRTQIDQGMTHGRVWASAPTAAAGDN